MAVIAAAAVALLLRGGYVLQNMDRWLVDWLPAGGTVAIAAALGARVGGVVLEVRGLRYGTTKTALPAMQRGPHSIREMYPG